MRITGILLRDVYKQIESYSKFHPSPLSIKKFIDFGESFRLTFRRLYPGSGHAAEILTLNAVFCPVCYFYL